MNYHPRMKRSLLACAFLLLLCFSSPAQTKLPDDGKVKDGAYFNLFFSFGFTYPKDWVVHDEAINDRIQKRAKEQAAKTYKPSELNEAYVLFTVSRHARGTPVPMNPTILVVAESLERVPGNPNGKDYLLSLRPLQAKKGSKPLVDEPVEFRVAGMQFFRDDYSQVVNDVPLRKAIFVTVKKGYALVFSFNGEDQKSVEEMAEAMKTILPLGRGGNL